MGTKSPSKYMSLERLKEIQNNYYSNLDKGIDYNPDEVDQLIWEKQTKTSEVEYFKYQKDLEIHEKEEKLKQGFKYCTGCKVDHHVSAFSPRKEVKSKYKSQCKFYRNKIARLNRNLPF